MKKTNLFITGGSGFVGKNLVKQINNEYNYTYSVLSRRKTNRQNFVLGDLMDLSSLDKIIKKNDIVIHLALSKNYPENITMTNNLLEICEKKKIKKIILLSSMAAKRNYPDEYGKTKKLVEEQVKNSKLNYTILRPTMIYGKGSTGFNFIIGYLEKIPFLTPIIGNGRYIVIPVNVDDIIETIIVCIKNKKTDKKEYDIVGGEKMYFVDLVNELKKELKIKKPNIHFPVLICKMIATILPSVLSKDKIKNLTQGSLADIEPAKKDFGYNPKKLPNGEENGYL